MGAGWIGYRQNAPRHQVESAVLISHYMRREQFYVRMSIMDSLVAIIGADEWNIKERLRIPLACQILKRNPLGTDSVLPRPCLDELIAGAHEVVNKNYISRLGRNFFERISVIEYVALWNGQLLFCSTGVSKAAIRRAWLFAGYVSEDNVPYKIRPDRFAITGASAGIQFIT